MGQQKYTEYKREYNKQNYQRISLNVRMGEREIIAAHAAAQGESVNAFINRAIKNQIAQDNEKE